MYVCPLLDTRRWRVNKPNTYFGGVLQSSKSPEGYFWNPQQNMFSYRSSRPDVFCKRGVLRNFTKFTGKHLCQSLFFNKIAGLSSATLLKKRLWHRCFPVNFMKFLRTPFFIERLWWLLLFVVFLWNSKILHLSEQPW